MKVLYVIPANLINKDLEYSPFVRGELLAAKRAGINYEVFYFTNRNSLGGLINSRKVLLKLIQQFQPDFIHAQYGTITSFLVMLCRPKVPWIITFGGNDILGHPYPGILWKMREKLSLWMSRISAAKATGIICVSENIKQRLPMQLSAKTKVIPRGVDMNIFKPVVADIKTKRQERVILFNQSKESAREKNLPLAKEAVETFKKLYPQIPVKLEVMMGKSTGEVVEEMNNVDILLVTSTQEGSPNIVKEAMACNLPVVAVGCGDVADRLRDVVPSEIVSYNPENIAEALHRVLQAGARSNGREMLIRQGLDAETVANKLIGFYQSVLA